MAPEPAFLPPLPAPIALFPQLVAQQPETIILREKVCSLTGDSFEIKLLNGNPILKVDGKAMSISGRKKVYDMQGNNLFDIVQEHLHLHRTFKVVVGEHTPHQKEVTVKSGFSLKGSKATITFTSHSGKAETLQMRGNFFATSADITDETKDGVVVARINRQWLKKNEFLFGQQTYAVQVAPGMDLALVAALCICLDEANEAGKK